LPIVPEEYLNVSYLNSTRSRPNEDVFSSLGNNHSYSASQRKRRIKAPDSLKSPLAPWRDPVENWRALVTEDVLLGPQSPHHHSKATSSHNQPSHMPQRRHTMNLADIRTISTNLSSLNIFSGFSTSRKQIKVSDNWELAKSRLTTPIYFKSGPGYDDSFGFVSNQELVKVRSSVCWVGEDASFFFFLLKPLFVYVFTSKPHRPLSFCCLSFVVRLDCCLDLFANHLCCLFV
jgi:hypothetical protein